jgi:hypothetical protein
LCPAAILYVQVEGEDAIGEEKLQEGDSVQSVVLRAVEQRLIRPIFWMDVTGWQLRESRQLDAPQIASGTSSEPLLDLPPFPSKSLLTITRRPVPSITRSSSSSLAASGKEADMQ